MFTATMSDTGESITGGTDMLAGILSIVYKCDYGKVQDACQVADMFLGPVNVYPQTKVLGTYHWSIDRT